jgi:hypothetical protein
VRHWTATLLALAVLVLGTGAAEHVHNLAHAREDAAAAAAHHRDDHHAPLHDEHNCAVHAQLHAPLLGPDVLPLLIAAGLFVAFVTQLAPRLTPQLVPARIRCRGPPAR